MVLMCSQSAVTFRLQKAGSREIQPGKQQIRAYVMKMRVFIATWTLLFAVLCVLPVYGKGNEQLNTALIKAAEKGDLKEVRALIAKGADVNTKVKDRVTGTVDWTPLSFAYESRHMDVVLELLNKGADINAGWLPSGADEDINVYRANLELDRVYKHLMSTLTPQQQKALREEQQSWSKRRDAEADRIARTTSECCGSAYRVDRLSAMLDITRKRTEVLKHYTPQSEVAQGTPTPPVPQPVPTPTPPTPRIEKAALKRAFIGSDQRYNYLFDFDFVNSLAQPIEIISVTVLDMNKQKVEQDWAISGPNFDTRILTHELSGNHPLVKMFSKPGRGTPLEQATVSSVGGRMEIKVTNRILSAGQAIRPSGYILASKNKYDSLSLRVAYKVNGNLQEVSRTFTVGMREEDKSPSASVPQKPPSTTPPVGGIFAIPTSGYIGFGWTGDSGHRGIDIWTGKATAGCVCSEPTGCASAPGNEVRAAYAGTVEAIYWGDHSGNWRLPTASNPNKYPLSVVVLKHTNVPGISGDIYTTYQHLANNETNESYVRQGLSIGDNVKQNDIIGREGNWRYYKENALITHLHFEVAFPVQNQPMPTRKTVNPMPYLGLNYASCSGNFIHP
jgi:uncharacterized protein YecT (DUF1311 family)/murein DD-endopeptidase MepM/ murein hydrolase activator NlpD